MKRLIFGFVLFQFVTPVLAGVDVCDDQSFIGSPPTFTCNFPDWPVDQTDLLRVVSVVVDYQNWLTTITIKGPQT